MIEEERSLERSGTTGLEDNEGHPGAVVHNYNPSTLEARVGGLPHIQDQPKLVSL